MVDNLEALLGPDTCRLCLKSGRSPTPVSNENLEGSLMAIKIDILTSVKVAPSDKVCPMCRINVKNFYDFRIMCVQSDARIKGFAAKMAHAAAQEDLSVIKSDQVIRSYKRVRRTTGELDKQTAETAKTANDLVQGTVDLYKSTADLFKSKAESGSSSGGLFKLKTKSPLMRTYDSLKGAKRPLIITGNPSTSTESTEKQQKTLKMSHRDAADPFNTVGPITPNEGHSLETEDQLLSSEDPLMETDDSPGDPLSPATGSTPPPLVPISSSDPLRSVRDRLSSARDPLSTARDRLCCAVDPLSSAIDPLSSDPLSAAADTISSVADPLSPEEETSNITVEPLSPARKDGEDHFEDKECRPGEMMVKIENTLEEESISDTQSVHNDNIDSDDESETETDAYDKTDKDTVGETLILPEIKKELPDCESTEDSADEGRAQQQENMEEMVLKPEEVIIPELKREPEDPEMFLENEYDDVDNYSEESPSFSGESVPNVKEEPKRQRGDTESLEVLVDPLMLMDEDHDAQMESKLSRLSPVLGNGTSNKSNGKLPLPPLNGSRSDKQRGLEFVKKLLGQNTNPGDGQPGSSEVVEKPYRCASCDLSFAYYKSYVKHKDRHLGVLSTHPCTLCPAIFSTNRELHIHMRKHVEKTFLCDRCYRSFPSKERLQAHYSLHTGDKAHTCDVCQKTFAYRSSVILHMKKMHGEMITGGTFLRCPKCPTEWNTPQELKQHMEMHESEEAEASSFLCPICSLTFPSKSILNVHARIHQKSK